MGMMFVVGALSNKVQPKYLIAAGAIFVALSMYQMTGGEQRPRLLVLRAFAHAARRRPAADLPAEHDGVVRRRSARQDRPGVGHAQRGAQHRRLARRRPGRQRARRPRPVPSEPADRARRFRRARRIRRRCSRRRATSSPTARRSAQAQQQAIAWIGQQLQAQTSLLSYVDAFWVLTLLALAAVPLALTLRKVKLGGGPKGMH